AARVQVETDPGGQPRSLPQPLRALISSPLHFPSARPRTAVLLLVLEEGPLQERLAPAYTEAIDRIHTRDVLPPCAPALHPSRTCWQPRMLWLGHWMTAGRARLQRRSSSGMRQWCARPGGEWRRRLPYF